MENHHHHHPPIPAGNDPTDLWDWENLFNFPLNPDEINTDDQLLLPWPPAAAPAPVAEPAVEVEAAVEGSSRVRKRDPRLICPNFIAGIVPCACPELDALAAAEEAAAEVAAGAKKRVRKSGGVQIEIKCQVPGCEVDIRELKGYHRRHRVCLSCATATSVFLDGEQKRYCQQCGKFHLLPDFDEGKRSCRRKLEKHNKRRRRKPDSKNNNEKELENDDLLANLTGETSNGTEIEIILRENSTGSDEGNNENASPICTLPSMQNEQSISILSTEEEGKFNNNNNNSNNNINVNNDDNNINNNGKATDSPVFYENKSVYSSSCPTGRISFKLYDWNPAEFPRRLRHQIFEWLSSMPVELEGYIRPGCTILTIFIAMPQSMWDKLSKDAAALVKNLVNTPGSLLLGKGTFLIYLDNTMFQILKDGTSLMNIRMEVHAPKIHYVHPTFFEVGKPIEFIICGSFLNQPKFRSLVSFNGKYVMHNCNIVGNKITGQTKDDYFSNSHHEMFRISISHTEPDIHGPAFIEVDNVSGLSNFVPVLFGTKHLCTELEKIQNEALNVQNNISSCEYLVSKQNLLSELLLDIAWLQKENSDNNKLSKVSIQRLTHLLRFLVSKKLINILEIVLCSLENLLAGDILSNLEKGKHDADVAHFLQLINHAKESLHDTGPLLTQQGKEKEKDNNNLCSTSEIETETVLLVPKQTLHRERCRPEFGRTWSMRYPSGPTRARFAAALMVCVLVCVTACIVLLHPHEPGPFAVSVRRYLYRGS